MNSFPFVFKMADADNDRYEDEETTDFSQSDQDQTANNHHGESDQPTAGDDNEVELQKQPEDLDIAVDSADKRFDADEPSPPGETQESTDQNDQKTASEEGVEKNSSSKDGEDERFTQSVSASNLER